MASATAFVDAIEATNIAKEPATVKWECTIYSTAPLLGDSSANLQIKIIDLYSDVVSIDNDVEGWLPPRLAERRDGSQGWSRTGPITVPSNMRAPGAVLIRKISAEPNGSVDYISSITLVSPETSWRIRVESWVASQHNWRVFFGCAAYLPKDTPASLREQRQKDLEQLQGTPEKRLQKRSGADRIYWYQTYDDLGNDKAPRPNLGGSKALPYPRRLATNRGSNPDGSEVPPEKGQQPWIPYDETFSYNKAAGFQGDTLSGTLSAAFAIIQETANQPNLTWLNLLPSVFKGVAKVIAGFLPFVPEPLAQYEDYDDVLAMFKLDADQLPAGFQSIRPSELYPQDRARGLAPAITPGVSPYKTAGGAWDFRIDGAVAEDINRKTAQARVGPVYDSATGLPVAASRGRKSHSKTPPQPGALDVAARVGQEAWERARENAGDVNDLLYFTVPRVLEGRPDAWHEDVEYGRQYLAGYHPMVIGALKELPEAWGSAIRGEHLNAELQGATLEQLVAEAAAGGKPRLYFVDYWIMSAFWEEQLKAQKGKKDARVLHQGRAIFYLQKDETTGADSALIPIAFELAGPTTHQQHPGLPATAGLVYARAQLAHKPETAALWSLAKAVFNSVDFGVHEVYSHFTRSHAVMEPFLIALRRNISTMHPVFKLMLPHFRYTLNINRNARSSLINANGIIEQCFSPGEFSMRLGCLAYGLLWAFKLQALPEELAHKGMLGPDGRPWLDYPFATDGLDIWKSLTSYFESYLRLYYKSDEDVVGDTELQAWWHEVKTEGHPDLVAFGLRTEEEVWGFTGPIPSLPKLVHVLATVAWIASGHHASVNFGQYDYVSFILNTSSLIRRQIPAPDPSDPGYKELVNAALGSPQEAVILKYLSDPLSTAKVMATVQLLSSHAEDEQTLDEPNTYLTEPEAVAANLAFMEAMRKLDDAIASRNVNPANWARYSLGSGPARPMAYTLLAPSSGAGITGRGVPYSVSI